MFWEDRSLFINAQEKLLLTAGALEAETLVSDMNWKLKGSMKNKFLLLCILGHPISEGDHILLNGRHGLSSSCWCFAELTTNCSCAKTLCCILRD